MADIKNTKYSDSDNEVLSTYLKSIDKIPLLTYEEEYATKDEAKTAYFNQLDKAGITLDKMSLATVPYIGRKLKSGKIKPVFYFRESDKNLLLV